MKKLIVALAAILGAAALCWGQQGLPQLPNDPAVKVGKLDNGMTYYIRHNANPEKRAEFYLATNVGSIQETPEQDGLAHFLEHMCFNGTKNFPGKGIINYLESIGASFGGNVNASTGQERTIYLLTNIPLVNDTVVDSCILIMHDYSHFVNCDPEEIDKERGVIVEEKRTRNTAGWRMFIETNKILFAGTPYETNTLIGGEEQLKTFAYHHLTDFYHTWYRPDMQALIVVGDINPDEVEAKIKKIFADIPAAVNPKAKDVITYPKNVEPIVGIITDPEATNSSLTVYWKSDRRPNALNSTPQGMMQDILENLIGQIMNERLSEIAAKPDAPFINAQVFGGTYNNTMDVVLGSTAFKEGNAVPALETLLTETKRAQLYGFSDSEIERAKAEIISQYEAEAKRADSRKNSEFVMPLISHFINNQAYMEPDKELEMAKQITSVLNAEVVNKVASMMITKEDMVVIYQGPSKEGSIIPTEAELKAVINKVAAAEIARPAGEEIPTEFLNAALLKGSKIKKTAKGLYGSTELTLANGVKVILYPTDIEKDKIRVSLLKKGGESLISDDDLYSFDENIWTLYQRNTGVGKFSNTVLGKMLSGKQVSVGPFINAYTHGILVSSTAKDIETGLQLAYLYFTEPRFDADEYNKGINQIKAVLPNLNNMPNFKFQKEMTAAIYDSPRRFTISDDVLAKASLATMERVYKGLFKDAAGTTVIVSGDFNVEAMTPLVQKYFGSLKKGGKATDWSYRGDSVKDGKFVHEFKTKMEAPKASVLQGYKVDTPYSMQKSVAFGALDYILDMVYVETLREDEGGTYGASASARLSRAPHESGLLQVYFDTNNEKADKLRALAQKGVKTLAENGPTAEQFDKAKKNLEKKIPEQKVRLLYWENAIKNNVLYGGDYDTDYKAAVEALTPEMVKEAAAAFINSANAFEVVMRPE